ncbi:hypothetical protein HW115_06550 [Verrucomicrobiaceae bacterium N1E253]|uniref:Glycosyl hydrolases family 43 n=1 Tax=Oceaniferula marina TaxID=2748318 RepID=A0A851GCG4_9BACT|nr:glycoside hydrolase family protein [Oceaniferula marina]NWK55263.1 hypothetical protein [Oceaniferula marina]
MKHYLLRATLAAMATLGSAAAAPESPDLLEGLNARLQHVGYAINDPEFHIWGCSPIMDIEGKVHLFVARWSSKHNHFAWKTHCEIAHYVGNKPEGPFEFSDIVVQGTGGDEWDSKSPHNPCIRKVDDKYVLLYIANSGKPFPASQRIGMKISDSLYGPWKKIGKDGMVLAPSTDPKSWTHKSGCGVNNPAFVKSDDGRYFLYFKSQTLEEKPKKMGLAIADKLEGPYIIQETPVTNNKSVIEDGYAFRYNNHFFMITTDNHGMFNRGGGLLWRSKNGLTFDHVEPAFLLMDQYIPKSMFIKPTFVKGNNYKFERPQVLSIEGKPSYIYMPSQCNLEGNKVSASFILKITPGNK